MNRVMAPIKATFSALWGVIQDFAMFLADGLVDAWNNPTQAAKDFGDMIWNNVVARLRGFVDMAKSSLDVGSAAFKLLANKVKYHLADVPIIGRAIDKDTVRANMADAISEIEEGGKRMAAGLLQAATGSEDAGASIRKFGADVRDAARSGYEAGVQIQELNEQIEKLRIQQEVPLAKLRLEYEELRNVARDTQKTEEERLSAADRAIEARGEILEMELRELNLMIEKMELQQSLNDTSREEQLELQKLIAKREQLTANAERELGRVLSQRSSILTAIETERAAEEASQQKVVEGLQQRANQYRDVLKSEVEMKQRAHEQELAGLKELLEAEVLTRQEYDAIKQELTNQWLDERLELERNHTGSLLELEGQLAQAKLDFRMAVSEEDREIHAEEMKRIQERIDAITQANETEKAERKSTVAQGIVANTQLSKSAAQTSKSVIDSIIGEILARQLAWVMKSIPFPFNIAAGPAAVASTKAMISAVIPGFQQGGMTSPGQKIITINEDSKPEYIVNAESTRRALPLLEQINRDPGFAANMTRALEMNRFQQGGLTGRASTAADLPFSPSGNMEASIARAIREGMEGVRVDARISAAQIDEDLRDYHEFQTSIGN